MWTEKIVSSPLIQSPLFSRPRSTVHVRILVTPQIVVNDPVRQQDENQNAIILEVEIVENVPLLAFQQPIRGHPHVEPLNNNYNLDDVEIDPQIRHRMNQFFERFERQNQERINEIQQRLEAILRRHEREISNEELEEMTQTYHSFQ